MGTIRIQSLGPLRLWLNEELLPDRAWPTQKSRQLFEILLINHGRLVTADKLMEYLWPALGVKQARNNLWVSISQARRVLEPDLPSRASSMFILKQGDGYQFQPNQDCWIDIEAFYEAIDRSQNVAGTAETVEHLQNAVDLYQGDLLDHDPYAEWTIMPRRQLREAFLNASLELASAYAYQGEFRRSVNLCRNCLNFDNSRESIYRALMLYLYCAGKQSEALQVYEQARQKLLEEIGVEPATQTKILLQQIQNQQVIGVDIEGKYPPHDDMQSALFLLSQMPLVGRTQELNQLIDLLRELKNRRSLVGLVTGESGIGKSRLLQEATERARQEGVATLFVSCYQIEQNLLYEPLIDLVRQVHQAWPELIESLAPVWLFELRFLIPEIIGSPRQGHNLYEDATEAQQGRLFQAVLQYLSLAGGESGLVITVEDIQWADEGTLLFLHYLGSRIINECGLLLLLSYRQEDRTTDHQLANFLHHLQRLQTTTTVHLDRLTKDDLDALLNSQALIPDSWSNWLYDETLGNPYFIVSILQSLVEHQLAPDEAAGQSQPPPGFSLPRSIKESIKDRLRRLETRERVILEWIAVYGRPLDFKTLKAISGQEDGALLEIVDHLLRRNFLLEGPDGIDFSHHKVAEFLYDELSTIRRIVSHQKIGQTLREIGEDSPALLAYHFVRAGETEMAITYWLKAGQAALGGYALRLAASHFGNVLQLADDPTSRLEAYIGLGYALTLLDEVEEATTALQAGISLSEEASDEWRRARLGFRYAQLVSRQNPADAAEVEIRRALLLAKKVQDENLIACLLLLLSVAQASEGMLPDALDAVLQARTLSQKKKEQHLEAQTLNELGFIYTQLGEFKNGIDVVQEALAIEADSPDLGISTYSWNILGRAFGGAGKYQQAFNAFERCRQQAAEIEDRFFLAQVPNMLGWLYRDLYAFQHAQQNDQESIELALRYDKGPIEISARLNLCLDWLGMERWSDSYAALQQIEKRIKAGHFGFHQWRWRLRLLHIWGLYYLQTGQAELAISKSENLLDLAQNVNTKKYICLAHQLLGDALIELNRFDEARIALERAVQLAESISFRPVLWEAGQQLVSEQPEKSKKILLKARSLVRETAGQLSDPGLQQGFLESPTIQALLSATNNLT
jgi:DNA-binding SARP family transcriptional activator